MVNFKAFGGCRGTFHEMIKEREQTLPLRKQTVSFRCLARIYSIRWTGADFDASRNLY